jgi:hypothetical protein
MRILGRGQLKWALLLCGACASYTQETAEIRSLYLGGSYDRALQSLDSSALRESSNNRLLYQLERAMILDRLRRYQESRKVFLNASQTVDELYTTSISKTAASFVVSDSVSDYEGEDYEKVAIHTMLALSFLGDDKLKEARVEARKINSRLNEINEAYDKNSKNRYSEDAFARYLAGMIYESLGEIDAAIIDYRAALKAYNESYQKYFSTNPPDALIQPLSKLLKRRKRKDEYLALSKQYSLKDIDDASDSVGFGEVAVVHEVGHIATKSANEFLFGVGSQAVRFSFPYIAYRSNSFGKTGIEVNGNFISGEMAQNFDAIAAVTLEDRRTRMLVKQGARLLAKGQLVEQTRQQFGMGAAIVANIFTAATETADTRSWTSLSSALYVTRARLPAGEQQIRVKTNGEFEELEKLKVPERGLVIIRARRSR